MINLKNFDKKKLFKSKAKIVILVLLLVLIVSIMGYGAIKKSQEQKEEVKKAQSIKDIKVKTTEEVISTDELWRNKFEEKMEEQVEAHSAKTGKQIDEIKKIIEQNESGKGDSKNIEAKISNLTKEIQDIKVGSNIKINETPIAKNNEISQYNLDLENAQDSDKYKTLKTADNYIPAGSFARAVLLSGVDAETGLNSSSEPDPILIRIIDHGTLPRKFKSDLKDCHIIGAAYGNLSSERAKIRLEKLSCTEIATAEVVETEVAGYVTGEDGRAGIRGEVVSTEGKLLTNSFAAGLLSGFSDTINPRTSSQPQTVIQEIKDGKIPKQGTNEKIKVGFAAGASSSMDRLSKYYIDRAESLQPIVQIGAGRKVDVIFTEGVFFGSSELKKAIAKKRDEAIKNKSGNADASLIRQLD
jgi:conjugal transfer pilus assembly protein TraB